MTAPLYRVTLCLWFINRDCDWDSYLKTEVLTGAELERQRHVIAKDRWKRTTIYEVQEIEQERVGV